MNIERIKKEIDMQTRNGRREVYVRTTDLLDLLPNIRENSVKARITMNVDDLNYLVEEYERNQFKNSLKVEQYEINIKKVDEKNYNIEKER